MEFSFNNISLSFLKMLGSPQEKDIELCNNEENVKQDERYPQIIRSLEQANQEVKAQSEINLNENVLQDKEIKTEVFDSKKELIVNLFEGHILFQVMEFLPLFDKKITERVSRNFHNAFNVSIVLNKQTEQLVCLQRNFTQFSLNKWVERVNKEKEPSYLTSIFYTNTLVNSVFKHISYPFKQIENNTSKVMTEFPEDIIYHILRFLPPLEKKKLERVNTLFHRVVNYSLTDIEKRIVTFRKLEIMRPHWLGKQFVSGTGSLIISYDFMKNCIFCPLSTKERENRVKFFFDSPKAAQDNFQHKVFHGITRGLYRGSPIAMIPKEEIINIESYKQVKIEEHSKLKYWQNLYYLRGIYSDGKHIVQDVDVTSSGLSCLLMILLDQGKKLESEFVDDCFYKGSKYSGAEYSKDLSIFVKTLNEANVITHKLSIHSVNPKDWQDLMTTYTSLYIPNFLSSDEDYRDIILDSINPKSVTIRDPSQGRRITISTDYFLNQMTKEKTCVGIIDKENL